jgi:putative FmdB family regulatory protein
MPTYDYECNSCGHRFEVRQSFTDAPVTTCPVCQGEVRRVFHPVGIVFKGTGWYITDSRKGGEGAEAGAKAGEKSEAKAEGTSEAKSEAKSDAKAESKPEKKAEPAAAKTDS